jgi:hypothetical protein
MPRDFRGLGILEWPIDAANARAVRYRERATQLREMAEDIHLVGHVRDSLFRLADQLDQLAVTVERSFTS